MQQADATTVEPVFAALAQKLNSFLLTENVRNFQKLQ